MKTSTWISQNNIYTIGKPGFFKRVGTFVLSSDGRDHYLKVH